MGVQGLQRFLETHNYKKKISIEAEIRKWKRNHPNVEAIIVFDGRGMWFRDDKFICGGSSADLDRTLEEWLIQFKRLDVKLVFFFDLNLDKQKNGQSHWLNRKNDEFDPQIKLYEKMDAGMRTDDLIEHHNAQGTFTSPNLLPIAFKYCEIHFGIEDDMDLAIARYAWKNNAIAIFSVDSDFLIFNVGSRWWNFNGVNYDEFTTIEYDRAPFLRESDLLVKQLPLFATLIGNDFMQNFKPKLKQFRRNLRGSPNEFKRVAKYLGNTKIHLYATVREYIRENNSDIDRFTNDVLQDDPINTDEFRTRIVKSIESYDVRSEHEYRPPKDPILQKLLNSNRFEDMMMLKNYISFDINAIQRIKIPITHNEQCSVELNEYLIEMLKKKVGFLNVHKKQSQPFTLLAKKSYKTGYQTSYVEPIYPEGSMHSLNELLTEDENMNGARWNLLAWMLSISDKERDKLQWIEEDFKIVCASLLVLVQKNIFSKRVADGIVIVELAASQDKLPRCELPDKLWSYNVQAAHTYRKVYNAVKEVFEIVGLTASVSNLLRFDGVYLQYVMTDDKLFERSKGSIAPFRVYGD